jgi:hypothetical protein
VVHLLPLVAGAEKANSVVVTVTRLGAAMGAAAYASRVPRLSLAAVSTVQAAWASTSAAARDVR